MRTTTGSTENWTPYEFGPPTTFDTATIGNSNPAYVDHNFAANDQVNALTISGGSDLYTNGYEAIVDNNGTAMTLVTGAGSYLRVEQNNAGPAADSFDTDLLTVANGASVYLLSGRLEVDSGKLDIATGGTVFGRGAIDLEGSLSAAGTLLENDGELRAGHTLDIFPPVGFDYVLDINVVDADGRIDLDGTSGDGRVTIGNSGTLDIGAPLLAGDAYSDLMTFGANSRLVMSAAWSADSNSTLDVYAEYAPAFNLPDTATISGGAFTSSGTVNVNSGTLVVEPTFTATSATVNVGGQGKDATLQLNGTATLGNLQLNGAGAGTANLTVNGNTTISQATLDWDADGANITTVGTAGVLTLNVGTVDVGNNVFDGTINNSGQIGVNLTNPADTWTMAGTLNMNTATGAEINAGNMIVTGDVNFVGSIPAVPASATKTAGGVITAGVPGTSVLGGNSITLANGSVLNANGGIVIVNPIMIGESGSTLNNYATMRLEGDNIFSQGSQLNNYGTMLINGATSFDWVGQRANFDGAGTNTWHIGPGASLSMTADGFDTTDDTVGSTIMIDEGGERISLSPARAKNSPWRVPLF
ncbi:MAG: hypothetical protein R3C10_25310 [Pirellulales bacterium]